MKFAILNIAVMFTALTVFGQPPNCADTSFRKFYSVGNDSLAIRQQISTADGGTCIVGNAFSSATNTSSGIFIRTTSSGQVAWGRRVSGTSPNDKITLDRLAELPDHSLVASGLSANISSGKRNVLVIKLDALGNLNWQKDFLIDFKGVSSPKFLISNIEPGKNDDVIISFNILSAAGSGVGLVRLNSTGTIIWQKTFIPDDDFEQLDIGGTVVTPTGLLMAGRYMTGTPLCQDEFRGVFATSLNYADGSTLSERFWCLPKPPAGYPYLGGIYSSNLNVLDNGNVRLNSSFTEGAAGTQISDRSFLTCDFNSQGDLEAGHVIVTGFSSGATQHRISSSRDGQWQLAISRNNSSKHLTTIDATGKIVNGLNSGISGVLNPSDPSYFNMPVSQFGASQMVYAISSKISNQFGIELLSINHKIIHEESCFGKDSSAVRLSQISLIKNASTWKSVADDVFTGIVGICALSSIAVLETALCSEESQCQSIKMEGPDTLCIAEKEYIIIAHKNAICRQRVNWKIESMLFSSIVQIDDTTISVRVKKGLISTETIKIFCALEGCTEIVDSLTLTLLPKFSLEVSAEQLCVGETAVIAAPGWIRRYLWSDGSVQQTLQVDKPGRYWLRAETPCGDLLSDTVEIRQRKAELNLQNTLVRCTPDSARLVISDKITGLQWQPITGVAKFDDSTFLFFPPQTQVYHLTGYNTNGCSVFDSIVVKVQPTQDPWLPNEGTVCKGENVKLETGTRFRNYLWSTGGLTSGISISQAGTYSVEVIDELGCRWYDTIVVKPGECGVSLAFPNAFTPNGDGRNDVFKPRMVKNIARYTLEVFNRYGQLVFKSRDMLLGWNGQVNGKSAESGVYVWTCRTSDSEGTINFQKGTIILLK